MKTYLTGLLLATSLLSSMSFAETLTVDVTNTTQETLHYCDLYAPSLPPGATVTVAVEHRTIAPGEQATITINLTGGLDLNASVNFVDNNGNTLTFAFNDPPQFYAGGDTGFNSNAPQYSDMVNTTYNPHITPKKFLWSQLHYYVSG